MAVKKRITLLLVCIIAALFISIPVQAEDGATENSGVRVEFKSDKDTYSSGDTATFTVTVTNNNDVDIKDFYLSYTLPSVIKTPISQLPDTIDIIKAGESTTLTLTTVVESDTAAPVNVTLIIIIAAIAVVVISAVVIFIVITKNRKKSASLIIIGTLFAGSLSSFVMPAEAVRAEVVNTDYKRAGVHDPSIVKDPETGTYYVFGSHMAWAKSTDLISWSTFKTNINSDYNEIFGDIWNSYCYTPDNSILASNAGSNLWAPDVIYNETMRKWCMYMSVNGNDWHSVIVLLTADNIEGPYEYAGGVMYSGFQGTSEAVANAAGEYHFFNVSSNKFKVNSEDASITARVDFSEDVGDTVEIKDRASISDVYKVLGENANLSRYNSTNISEVNAIDPNVEYDQEGNLWMTYGSWSAGIYQIKLDNETGLRDYDYTYENADNKSDAYLGYKIAGGQYNSGEGPYILKTDDYYYLFLSIGNLEASGGYNMRVYRSESIYGPYMDENGKSPITTAWINNLGYIEDGQRDQTWTITNKYTSSLGIKLMGAYNMYGISRIQVAQGHNSAFADDDGKMYVIYHSRFADSGESFELRVHQLFQTESGWLAAAPYEYSGETLSQSGYSSDIITGSYDFVIQDKSVVYAQQATGDRGIVKASTVTLNSDGTITGDSTGIWSTTSGANVKMTIDGIEYSGVFVEQQNELATRDVTMTFTLVGGNQCAWGVKNPEKN